MVSFSSQNQTPIFGRGLLLLALLLTFSSLLRGALTAPTSVDARDVDSALTERGYEEGLAANMERRSEFDLEEREASPEPAKKKHKGKKGKAAAKNATAAAAPAAGAKRSLLDFAERDLEEREASPDPKKKHKGKKGKAAAKNATANANANANAKFKRGLFSDVHDHTNIAARDMAADAAAAAANNGTAIPNTASNVQQQPMLQVNMPELAAGVLDMMAGAQVLVDGMTIMLQSLGVNQAAMNQVVQIQPNAMANMMAALNQATVTVVPVQKRSEDSVTSKMQAKRDALKAGEAY